MLYIFFIIPLIFNKDKSALSFLFIFLSFILGFRILFKTTIVPLAASFKYVIFTIIWLSITLGYVLSTNPILGGAFGFQVNLWLTSIIGNWGMGLFLVLTLLLFLIINFNISFDFLSNLVTSKDRRKGNRSCSRKSQRTKDCEARSAKWIPRWSQRSKRTTS